MYQTNIDSKIEFYNNPKFTENPFHPNGFKGTWNFSSHELIPEVFQGFLQRYFGQYKIRRIPLEKINDILNEIWEGPGSLKKVFELEHELKLSGKEVKFTTADVAAIKAKRDSDEDDILPLDDKQLDIGFGDTSNDI